MKNFFQEYQKILKYAGVVLFGLLIGFNVLAVNLDDSYPKIANHFLKWEILDSEIPGLAQGNLLVLDMEVQENSPEQIYKIRKINPSIIILAYINSVELLDNIENYNKAEMRNRLAAGIDDGWWLKDPSGRKISNWPYTSMLNLTDLSVTNSAGERFNDYLPNFVINNIKKSGLWDGVFYDNTWGDVAWVNSGNIDADNNGIRDISVIVNSAWSNGFKKVLAKTRNLAGPDFIIVGNGGVYEGYQSILNGMMFEDFPSAWESGGTWTGSMKTYLRLPELNVRPNISIINSFNKNKTGYSHFRFTLGSALLGNGFFSFNYSTDDYSQISQHDEYNFLLGSPQSGAYNLLAAKNTEIKPGLWRRDFKYGSVIVNSTNKEQLHVFSKEEMEKIKGTQDPKFNTGLKISYLKLAPQDGAILRRQNNIISNSPFVNGYFYRLYDLQGSQVRNGFFPYVNNFPGEAELVILDNLDVGEELTLSAGFGEILVYKNGSKINSFLPYTKNYRDRINLAVTIKNKQLDQIITGPYKGGPQVSIFSATGKLLGSFFAYDKNSRGGVSVAVGDVNGDGQNEIVTGPGPGLEPLIKIFSMSGVLQYSFLAYDKSFKGGVSVAVGDVNGDGQNEIVTGPGPGGGPHVRIFNHTGQVISSFFAYDKEYRGGIKVATSDINMDIKPEILVGIKNFY